MAVNRFYWPDESATSQLLDDLAGHLSGQGHRVHVVAGRGQHGTALPGRASRNGVQVHRIRTACPGGSAIAARLLEYLSFCLGASWRLFRVAGRGDLVLVKTDPPLMSVPAALIAWLRGARLVLWHQDLFPETAEALGLIRPEGRIARALRRLRNLSLGRAERHVAISEAMARRLAGEGLPRARIAVIPNWAGRGLAPVAAGDNPLRRDWNLEGRFVIGYSGNLGRAHRVERVAELVRLTHAIPGLVWVFIGGGAGLRRIERLQREIGDDKLRLHPRQPRASLALSLSLPDLHLVSLDPACEGLVVPSKLYGIMGAGRPVLNLGAADGAVAREIAAHGIGWTLGPDPAEWRAALERLIADRSALTEAGGRARSVHQRLYRAERALAAWEALLVSPRPRPAPVAAAPAEEIERVG